MCQVAIPIQNERGVFSNETIKMQRERVPKSCTATSIHESSPGGPIDKKQAALKRERVEVDERETDEVTEKV